MQCQKCSSNNVLVENVGEGKTKITCQSCGESKVSDQQGRRMLTDDRPAPDSREMLTS